jgi:GNAT superfamily N-acetyltransferase
MRALGQRPLFQLRGDSPELLQALDARGYTEKDETVLYALPIAGLTNKPIPRVTAFNIWEPLAIIREIWNTDGIGPARVSVMERAAAKTSVLARWNEKPAGAAFAAAHQKIAMVHGLVVLPHQRRQGVAEWLMRSAAFWGEAQGAEHMAVLCVAKNAGANALYQSLGFVQVGRYHYRQSPE